MVVAPFHIRTPSPMADREGTRASQGKHAAPSLPPASSFLPQCCRLENRSLSVSGNAGRVYLIKWGALGHPADGFSLQNSLVFHTRSCSA